jgi:hypothetical protein
MNTMHLSSTPDSTVALQRATDIPPQIDLNIACIIDLTVNATIQICSLSYRSLM